MVNSNPSLDFESDQNRRSNLESEFESTMKNQFGMANPLSLQHTLLQQQSFECKIDTHLIVSGKILSFNVLV